MLAALITLAQVSASDLIRPPSCSGLVATDSKPRRQALLDVVETGDPHDLAIEQRDDLPGRRGRGHRTLGRSLTLAGATPLRRTKFIELRR